MASRKTADRGRPGRQPEMKRKGAGEESPAPEKKGDCLVAVLHQIHVRGVVGVHPVRHQDVAAHAHGGLQRQARHWLRVRSSPKRVNWLVATLSELALLSSANVPNGLSDKVKVKFGEVPATAVDSKP